MNFASTVIQQSAKYLDKIAYRDGTSDLCYGELCDRVTKTARFLKDLCLNTDDNVIISMEDCVDWPVVFLACLHQGIIPLPLSTSMGADLFYEIARFTNCKAVIAGNQSTHADNPARMKITRSQIQQCYSNTSHSVSPVIRHPDSAAWMNVSSGSTGVPKIAVHRHQTLFEMLRMSPYASFGMTSNSVIMSTAKMSWNYGLQNSITYTLGLGATAILIQEAPAAATVFEYMNRYRPDIVISSPSIIRRLMSPAVQKYSLPDSIRHFNSSGEHLPAPMYDAFLARFGIKLNSCIGMMETASTYAANPDWEHDRGTVGKPFEGVEIKLINDEIYVSSPANACYYFNNYEKTRETFIGRWVRTGDRGYFNEQGNLVFAGRVDDVFKVNDLIVNPIEIESEIMKYSGVENVAVSGVINARGIKEVHAFVISQDNFDSEQLKKYLEQKLFPHQMPKQIHTVSSFPETMTNKKDRKTLSKQLQNVT